MIIFVGKKNERESQKIPKFFKGIISRYSLFFFTFKGIFSPLSLSGQEFKKFFGLLPLCQGKLSNKIIFCEKVFNNFLTTSTRKKILLCKLMSDYIIQSFFFIL